MALNDIVRDVYKAACLEAGKDLEDHEFVLWLDDARLKTLRSVTNETESKEFVEKCRLAIIYQMSADFVVGHREWRNEKENGAGDVASGS